jgi:hypothetical protein
MDHKKLRENLINDMRDCIGTRDPIEYFSKLVSALDLLFDEIEILQTQNIGLHVKTALAIQWEPSLALDLLDAQINTLREDRDLYHAEISAFKKARMEDSVTQSYEAFCKFWVDTLGYHPFLPYKK